MALKVADRIKQLTTSTGTGDISFNATPVGFASFSSVLTSGDTTYYCIEENDKFEIGVGIYGSDNMVRSHILASSNGGNAINLGGSGTVFITYPAGRSVYRDGQSRLDAGASGIIFSNGTVIKEAKLQELTNVDSSGTISSANLLSFDSTHKSLLVGDGTGPSNDNNTIIGYGAASGTTGTDNTVVGTNPFTAGNGGVQNVSIGTLSGPSEPDFSSSASYGVSVGYKAGSRMRSNSTAIGHQAGIAAYEFGFVAVGSAAGSGIGSYSVAVGNEAADGMNSDYVVAVGYQAGKGAGGESAVWVGNMAGSSATSASKSIGIGYQAGKNSSANDSIYIGQSAGQNNSNNDYLYIGNGSPSSSRTLIKGDMQSKRLAIGVSDVTLEDTLYVGVASSVDTGLVIRGAVSQSANLTEWQNSAGEIQARMASSGILGANGLHVSGQGISIDSAVPTNPVNNLYNVAGTLYWNLAPIGVPTGIAHKVAFYDQLGRLTSETDFAFDSGNTTLTAGSTTIGDRISVNEPSSRVRIGRYVGDDGITESSFLTALGYQTATNASGATGSTVAGFYAGYNSIDVSHSQVVGYFAGLSASGERNTYIGEYAGANSSGVYNTFIGHQAGRSCKGSQNIEILASGATNSVVDNHSNKLHIANTIIGDTSDKKLAIGNVGASNITPDATLEILPKNSTDIGVIVQGAASQSANLQEWQANNTVPVVQISAEGSVSASGTISASGAFLIDPLVPSVTTNKLYNDGGTLKFNGSVISSVDTYTSGVATYASGQAIANETDILYVSGVAAAGGGGGVDVYTSGVATYASGQAIENEGLATYASGQAIENEAAIATNVSNISTNTSNISTNTSNISTNSGRITYASGQAIENESDIVAVSGIAAYASGHVHNDLYVSGVASYASGQAVSNETNITSNTTNISYVSGVATKTFDITGGDGSNYVIDGMGLNSASDPAIYLHKGHTYYFNKQISGHPFRISTSNGGAAYQDADGNSIEISGQGVLKFEVPQDAPDKLYYYCITHSSMNGPIYTTNNVDEIIHVSGIAAYASGQAISNESDILAVSGIAAYASGEAGGTTYTAGSGLTLVGNEFNIHGGTGNFEKLEIKPSTTTNVGLTVQSAASQSANLQEWQNSSENTLSHIDTGGVYTNIIGTNGTDTLRVKYGTPLHDHDGSSGVEVTGVWLDYEDGSEYGTPINTNSLIIGTWYDTARTIESRIKISATSFNLRLANSSKIDCQGSTTKFNTDVTPWTSSSTVNLGSESVPWTNVYASGATVSGVQLASHVPADTTNTLYNVGGTLYFNGSQLASAGGASAEAQYASGQAIQNEIDIFYVSGVAAAGGGDVSTEQLNYVSGIAVYASGHSGGGVDVYTSGVASYASGQAIANETDILYVSGVAATGGGIDAYTSGVAAYASGNTIATQAIANYASGQAIANETDILYVSGVAAAAGSTLTAGSGVIVDGESKINVYGGSGNFQELQVTSDNTFVPKVVFTGSGVVDTPITLETRSSFESVSGSGSALLFQGTQGQLFSITDNLSSGVIFNVSDITGLPLIEADASGDVKLGEFGRYVGVGSGIPEYGLDISASGRIQKGVVLSNYVPATTTNTLYNDGGTLKFNGSAVGGGTDTYTSGVATYASGQAIQNETDIAYTSGIATYSSGVLTGGTASGIAFFGDDNNLTESSKFVFTSGDRGTLNIDNQTGIINITEIQTTGTEITLDYGTAQLVRFVEGNFTDPIMVSFRDQGFGFRDGNPAIFDGTNAKVKYNDNSWKPHSDGLLDHGTSSARWQDYYGYRMDLENDTSSSVVFKVKGAASQSANLQEWQDSAGNTHSAINSSGDINLYNFDDGAGNNEYLSIDWSSTTNQSTIKNVANGTGTVRRLNLGDRAGDAIIIDQGGSDRIKLMANGQDMLVVKASSIEAHANFVPDFGDDNSFDIGTPSLRFANIYGVNLLASGVSVSGVFLANHVPASTTNRLYNDGGTLKFNGSAVGGGTDTYTSGVATYASGQAIENEGLATYASGQAISNESDLAYTSGVAAYSSGVLTGGTASFFNVSATGNIVSANHVGTTLSTHSSRFNAQGREFRLQWSEDSGSSYDDVIHFNGTPSTMTLKLNPDDRSDLDVLIYTAQNDAALHFDADQDTAAFGVPVSFNANSATNTPITAKGAASQSANLQEWQANDDVVVAQVGPDGSIASSGNISASGGVLLDNIVPSVTTNKLYNDGGTLKFNGSAVGGGSSLTAGSGITIDGADRINVHGGSGHFVNLEVNGAFTATTKSFLIDHPSKKGMKLQYASLEGPENGVYVRGTTDQKFITLPDYWRDLVDSSSITVTLTPVGQFQPLFVEYKSNREIRVGGVCGYYDYVVYGERKDVEKLKVEW